MEGRTVQYSRIRTVFVDDGNVMVSRMLKSNSKIEILQYENFDGFGSEWKLLCLL